MRYVFVAMFMFLLFMVKCSGLAEAYLDGAYNGGYALREYVHWNQTAEFNKVGLAHKYHAILNLAGGK